MQFASTIFKESFKEQTCGTAVYDPCCRESLLQLQDHAAYFGGLCPRLRHQILGLVALVEDNEAIKLLGAPLGELIDASGPVVAARDEGGVAQKYDACLYPHLHQ